MRLFVITRRAQLCVFLSSWYYQYARNTFLSWFQNFWDNKWCPPPRCGPKSVPKSQFCAHSLRYHRELSSEVFHELALLVCQKYIFKLIPKIFETTNVGAHPAGTDLSFMKIVFYFFKFEIKIYKPILTFDKKIPQKFFLTLVMIYRLSIKNFWFFDFFT